MREGPGSFKGDMSAVFCLPVTPEYHRGNWRNIFEAETLCHQHSGCFVKDAPYFELRVSDFG